MADEQSSGENQNPTSSLNPSTIRAEGDEYQKVAADNKADPASDKKQGNPHAAKWRIKERLKGGWEFAKKPESTNVAMAIATIVISVATVFTWREMHSGGTDTHELATQAQNQSAAAKSLAEAAKAQSDNTAKLAIAAGNQVGQLQGLVAATNQQNRVLSEQIKANEINAGRALSASIESARRDQRAWVGVVSVQTEGGVSAQDSFSFQGITLTIHNSGKTPALKLSGDCCMFETRVWTEPIPDYDAQVAANAEARRRNTEEQIRRNPQMADRIREFEAETASLIGQAIHTGGVIAPGVITQVKIAPSMRFGTGQSGAATSPAQPISPILPRPTTLYILGKFAYNDIFTDTERRTTKFCLMRLTGNLVTICPEGNWMD